MPRKLPLTSCPVHLILTLPYPSWSCRSWFSQTRGKEQSIIPALHLCRSTCKLPCKIHFSICGPSLFPSSATKQNTECSAEWQSLWFSEPTAVNVRTTKELRLVSVCVHRKLWAHILCSAQKAHHDTSWRQTRLTSAFLPITLPCLVLLPGQHYSYHRVAGKHGTDALTTEIPKE